MKATLSYKGGMAIDGDNGRGHITKFDTVEKVGGEDSAATPMEVMLQAMAACSFMDVVSIIKKKRKTVIDLTIDVEAERAEKHPMVFTKVHLHYTLKSPDAELKDVERAAMLSQTTYCGASAMFQRSGCEVTYDCEAVR